MQFGRGRSTKKFDVHSTIGEMITTVQVPGKEKVNKAVGRNPSFRSKADLGLLKPGLELLRSVCILRIVPTELIPP
jgi:hypothetical protein